MSAFILKGRTLFSESLLVALLNGWLGKVLIAVVAGASAWFARRPVERSAIMDIVDKRVQGLIDNQAKWIDHVTDAHKACEDSLHRVGLEVEQLRGELRQNQQVIESLSKIKP